MRAGPKANPIKSALPEIPGKLASQRMLEFCKRYLVHIKGHKGGQPLALEPWQTSIIRTLLDTKQKKTGLRQYRQCYLSVPRKNGKSTLGAALGLWLLYGDNEPGAEVISAAADTDQARIVFDVARSMVEACPDLRDMTQIFQRELVVTATNSRYRVISAEASTKHGLNIHGAILDELHVWPNRDLYDVLTTSTGGRRQPLICILTTAGDTEHGICAEVHRYAEQVKSGVIQDSTLLPIIYSAPEDADWQDEKVWKACNPALGNFRSLEEMQQSAKLAKEIPGRESAFRRLYLNQWGHAAAQHWISLASWDACWSQEPPPADGPVIIGLDLASTVDLTALVVLHRQEHGEYWLESEFWCPAEGIERRARKDRVPYPLFREQGWLNEVPGNVMDYSYLEGRIHALMRQYDVQVVAVDPWNSRGMTTKLMQDGVPVVEVPQVMSNLSHASKTLEQLVLGGKLKHDGNPLMKWCLANCVPDADGRGNIKPSKKLSRERIDGISALVTALSRALVMPSPRQRVSSWL